MTSVKEKTTNAPDASDASETMTPGLGAVEEQATSFRHVREARRTELVEDYVELIADLIDDAGEARPVDIAARLGVTKPTVNKMLKRLQQEELVTQRPYRAVFLTDAGRELAEASRVRHQIVESFLLALGIVHVLGIKPATVEHSDAPADQCVGQDALFGESYGVLHGGSFLGNQGTKALVVSW